MAASAGGRGVGGALRGVLWCLRRRFCGRLVVKFHRPTRQGNKESKALLLEVRAQLAERDIEIEQLKARIVKLKRMQFGRSKSEQIERLETELDELAGGARRRGCGFKTFPELLPDRRRRR
jgi:hypothetical protein